MTLFAQYFTGFTLIFVAIVALASLSKEADLSRDKAFQKMRRGGPTSTVVFSLFCIGVGALFVWSSVQGHAALGNSTRFEKLFLIFGLLIALAIPSLASLINPERSVKTLRTAGFPLRVDLPRDRRLLLLISSIILALTIILGGLWGIVLAPLFFQ